MRSEDRPRPGSVSLGGLLGWALYDWAGNAFATVVITFVFSAYFVDHVASDPTAGSTWWGLALGAAGVLVALSAPLLGAALDQAGRRKPWLVCWSGPRWWRCWPRPRWSRSSRGPDTPRWR